jgi:DNA-3-methyladenine glycosylase
MNPILPQHFYNRSPELVARDLLGKVLLRRLRDETLTGRITEVEAYLGQDDPASHTFVGKTARNAVLFGPPGFAYVYFIYGMHFCLNVSCLPDGEPGGVLFRALLPLQGIETMRKLRNLAPKATAKQLTGGPARLCEALDITRTNSNGLDLTSPASPLQIVDDGYVPGAIQATPRVGITKAADRPLRFLLG